MNSFENQKIAAVAITKNGAKILARLGPLLPQADIVVAQRFEEFLTEVPNQVTGYTGSVKQHLAAAFQHYDQLIFCVSLGAVVRLLAPHLVSKETDPGVLVIDDAAQFVVAVLSGHIGGANEFTNHVAELIGATPVVTTASDAGKTVAVDILGRKFGWVVEAKKATLIKLAAQVVNEEKVAIVQEAGDPNWWESPNPLPKNLVLFNQLEAVDPTEVSGVLWISHRSLPEELAQAYNGRLVTYRPPEA